MEGEFNGEFQHQRGTGEEVDNALGEVDVYAGVEVTAELCVLNIDDVVRPSDVVFVRWGVEELGEDVVGNHVGRWYAVAIARAATWRLRMGKISLTVIKYSLPARLGGHLNSA